MIDFAGVLRRFRPQRRVGCDFGTDTFKVVVIEQRAGATHLAAVGMTNIDWSDEDAAVRRVQVFLREHGVEMRNVAMNLADANMQVREMEFANMPERDLKMAIRWNFRESIEGPLEQYQVAYTEIGKSDDSQRRMLMAYGVSAAVVKQHTERAQKLGLKLVAVEPDLSALMAAVEHNVEWQAGERIGVLDLGFASAHLIIATDRTLKYARPLNAVGLERLGTLVQSSMATETNPRDFVRQILMGHSLLPEQQKVVDEYYRHLLLEIGRIVDGYCALAGIEVGQGIGRLLLCGGGCSAPNLPSYLEKNLGIVTGIFNPFARIDCGAQTIAHAPSYAVAVGLALPESE